jgi:hypothetical protein
MILDFRLTILDLGITMEVCKGNRLHLIHFTQRRKVKVNSQRAQNTSLANLCGFKLIDDLNFCTIVKRQPIFTKNRIEIFVFKFTLIVDTGFA